MALGIICPACKDKRLHTEADWKHHPYKGHGYAKEQGGWTHPDLKPKPEPEK